MGGWNKWIGRIIINGKKKLWKAELKQFAFSVSEKIRESSLFLIGGIEEEDLRLLLTKL